jgi:hypothetical protein
VRLAETQGPAQAISTIVGSGSPRNSSKLAPNNCALAVVLQGRCPDLREIRALDDRSASQSDEAMRLGLAAGVFLPHASKRRLTVGLAIRGRASCAHS